MLWDFTGYLDAAAQHRHRPLGNKAGVTVVPSLPGRVWEGLAPSVGSERLRQLRAGSCVDELGQPGQEEPGSTWVTRLCYFTEKNQQGETCREHTFLFKKEVG